MSSSGPNLSLFKAHPSPHGFQLHLAPFFPTTPALDISSSWTLVAFVLGSCYLTMVGGLVPFSSVESLIGAQHSARADPHQNIYPDAMSHVMFAVSNCLALF